MRVCENNLNEPVSPLLYSIEQRFGSAVEGGRGGFHAVLAKGKGKEKLLILVADEHAMGLAVGEDGWMELVKEAAEYVA